MCDHCVIRGRRAFAALPDEQQRLIRLAIERDDDAVTLEKGISRGEDAQREHDEHTYKQKVTPAREAIVAAVEDARASFEHCDKAPDTKHVRDILARLIENVAKDVQRIPTRLPS